MDRIIEFASNHYILTLAFGVVLFLLIQDVVESLTRKFKVLSPLLTVAKMNQGDLVIIDVREPVEYAKGFIDGARNIPVGKLDLQVDSLAEFKDKPLLLVCQTGTRSSTACKTLLKKGFADIYQLSGGMDAWQEHKYPVQRRPG
ncbi:MAG: rhodanese-like domain-containing protein [Methylococcales bacterium]|nr:rhodanese-like domain-containing protein [Methylococcales bacterium]